MSLAIRLMPEGVRTVPFSSIDATYMGVGTRFEKPIRMLVFQNYTDQAIMISFDGDEDHLPLPANGYIVLDITANKTQDTGFFLPEGSRIYVKELTSTPASGSVYVSTFYGAE